MWRWVVVAALVGLGVGVGLASLLAERRVAAWQTRAAHAEREVAVVLAQADTARAEAAWWQAVADSLRGRRDTLVVTRWRTILDTAWVGAEQTLPACQAALQGLRGLCRLAVDSLGRELDHAREEADDYRRGMLGFARSDSLKTVAIDSLEAVVRSVPVPPKKWFGLLVPKLMVGVGCAAGTGFGCGVIAGAGFTF